MSKTSIIQKDQRCYICHTTNNLHQHHIIFGKNRKKCDEDKLVIWLCREHHEGTNGVHGKNGHNLDIKLKQIAQKEWCKCYNKTKEDFIARYGRSYI